MAARRAEDETGRQEARQRERGCWRVRRERGCNEKRKRRSKSTRQAHSRRRRRTARNTTGEDGDLENNRSARLETCESFGFLLGEKTVLKAEKREGQVKRAQRRKEHRERRKEIFLVTRKSEKKKFSTALCTQVADGCLEPKGILRSSPLAFPS